MPGALSWGEAIDDGSFVHDDTTTGTTPTPQGERPERFAEGRILVVALKGWNDAGEAASNAVSVLGEALELDRPVRVVEDEAYFDYSVYRPHTFRDGEGKRHITWPSVIMTSTDAFADELLDADEELESLRREQIVTWGVDLDDGEATVEEAREVVGNADGRSTDADSVADADADVPLGPGDAPLFVEAGDDGDVVATSELDDGVVSEILDPSPRDPENLASDADLRVTGANADNLLLLLRGQEPTLRWRDFAERILRDCRELGVTRLLLVGALLADAPHSRPINVFVSSEYQPFRDELDVSRSEYQGPTGVIGVLSHYAASQGIPSVSMWASVPHYASQSPSPKAELAIVDKLEELLDVTVPRADLIERAERWEADVDAATGEDSEIAEYIAYLERAHDTVEAPEASGEAIAKEFERFLRQDDARDARDAGRGPGHASAPGVPGAPGSGTGPIPKLPMTPPPMPPARDDERDEREAGEDDDAEDDER